MTGPRTLQRPFSGRVVFDHLPKTAGTSINRWLIEALGDGNVSDILTGLHLPALRRYGGQYCLITGHLDFINAEGLDPRWQYTTILRDPIDRALSWLYFVVKHYSQESLPGIYTACKTMIETEGENVAGIIWPSVSNLYTAHFSRILGMGDEDDATRVANAKAALDRYDLAGTTDDYPGYIEQLSRLLNLTHIPPMRVFNKTEGRPELAETSTALKSRLADLNQLDLAVYEHVKQRLQSGFWRQSDMPRQEVEVITYSKRHKECRSSDKVTVLDKKLISNNCITCKEIVFAELTVKINEYIPIMQCGLHIIDDRGEVAFGINSTLMGTDVVDVSPGIYKINFQILADLPLGAYTLGVSLYDRTTNIPQELYWHDGLLDFSVIAPLGAAGIGYAPCRSQIDFGTTIAIEAYSR